MIMITTDPRVLEDLVKLTLSDTDSLSFRVTCANCRKDYPHGDMTPDPAGWGRLCPDCYAASPVQWTEIGTIDGERIRGMLDELHSLRAEVARLEATVRDLGAALRGEP